MSTVSQPQRRITLRSVGEILTDHTGNFYELCGDELRELGKLLVDRRGRVFEVADAEPPPVAVEVPVIAKQSIVSRLLNWFLDRVSTVRGRSSHESRNRQSIAR